MLKLINRRTLKPLTNLLRKLYFFIKNIIESPMPLYLSNFEYNRIIWNRYAKSWSKTKAFASMLVKNTDINQHEKELHIKYPGDEWGKESDVDKIVIEYIYPFITNDSVIAEIGVGGGRIAIKVVGRVRELHCFDISSEMLKRVKAALSKHPHVSYILLDKPRFSDRFVEKFDFVYSFDVFVHLDLHTMWKYFNEIRKILKDGGKAFIHTTNLKAPDGWKKFSGQKAYTVEGHYFVSPEIIDILAYHSNLKIIKTSSIDPTNLYLNRDYLVVLEKK